MAPKVTESYKAQLREKILEAAFVEFCQKGLDKTSLDDIARSIKIARGTIYLYFDSKQEIFEAISASMLDRLKNILKQHNWFSGDIDQTARAFYRESKQRMIGGSEKLVLELMAESSRNKELRRQRLLENRKLQEVIANVIQSQLGDEKISRVEMNEIALASIALYNGLNFFKVLGFTDEEIENSWARMITLVVEAENQRLKNFELVESKTAQTHQQTNNS